MKRTASLLSAFACSGALLVGCGDPGPTECTNPSSGMTAKYRVTELLVPSAPDKYAFDLNDPSGKDPDNQLGAIIQVLKSVMFDTQAGVTEEVNTGKVNLLVSVSAADLMNDSCAAAVLAVGEESATPPPAMPTGNETFTVRANQQQGNFKGSIKGGVYTSNNPARATTPVELSLQLPLVTGAPPIDLKVTAGRITFTQMGDQLINGQVNGAIKKTDVDNNIVPVVAQLLDERLRMNPTGSTETQIKNLFDNGTGCVAGTDKNFPVNGMTTDAAGGDGRIAVCEVLNNPTIKSVLRADVDLFDDGGAYKPNPTNPMAGRDSLSLGLAFKAYKAMW
jgi:hypothetical protein